MVAYRVCISLGYKDANHTKLVLQMNGQVTESLRSTVLLNQKAIDNIKQHTEAAERRFYTFEIPSGDEKKLALKPRSGCPTQQL